MADIETPYENSCQNIFVSTGDDQQACCGSSSMTCAADCCDFSTVLGDVPADLKIFASHSVTISGRISEYWQYYSNKDFRLRKTGLEIPIFLK
jgi:hypothetical protein